MTTRLASLTFLFSIFILLPAPIRAQGEKEIRTKRDFHP